MKRRKAREYALQFIYRIDFLEAWKSLDTGRLTEDLSSFWTETKEKDEDVRQFAEEIIGGTITQLGRIDGLLQDVADRWKLSRMASIDRNILRLATYEILSRSEIPAAVIINEALEIAKKYSTSESASFINGILDRIARENRGQTVP